MTNEDQQLREDIAKIDALLRLLFEQQFIRCGGRKDGDPTWDDLEQFEQDEFWRAALDAAPLLDAVEASRRDWAAEAMRLDNALAEIAERCDDLSAKADSKIGEVVGADLAWAAWGKAAQWMRKARSQSDPAPRPVCAVHPEEGR